MSNRVAQLSAQPLPLVTDIPSVNRPPFVSDHLLTGPFYYLQITDPNELSRYRDRYSEVSGNVLPEEYLRQALVYQFYKGYRPVAGFILNTVNWSPLRYFSYLDETIRQTLLFEEDLIESDFLEITSNWKSSELSSSESHTYYSVMLKQAQRQARLYGKKLLLGGSVIKPIKKLQQRLMTRIIYHGPIDHKRQNTVKEKQSLLKLYVVPVAQVRYRAIIVLWKRYLGLVLRTLLSKKNA